MTLTTTQPITSAELLDLLHAMTVGQQNAMRYGHDAYVNRRRCFFLKWPTTKAEAEALCPDYLTQVGHGQYAITELGLAVYRAYLHQPIVPPDAGSKPQTYHGTRLGRNYRLRDMWENKLPANGLRGAAEVAEPDAPVEAVERPDTPVVNATSADLATATPAEVVVESVIEVAPTPAVAATTLAPLDDVQIDITGMLQPLLAQIAALETKLAQVSATLAPPPRPLALQRKGRRAAMPLAVLV
ncbi:MAG: hypothetical protein HY862_07090 [Chloroflexi bacterium]|nr:hypothetical protein [Chloroflexota bacterium]